MPKPSDSIPRLPSHHVLGHLPAMRQDVLALQRRVARMGDLVRVRLGALETLWVSGPRELQEVLVERAEDFEKSAALRVVLRPIVGDGILVSQGSRYRRRRAVVAPAFQAGRIARYADSILEHTERTVEAIARHTEVDVASEMMRLTLEIVASTLFNTQVASDVDEVDRAVTQGSEAFARLLRSPLPMLSFTPAARSLQRAADNLDRIVYRIIAERRRSGEDPGDVLSMLLAVRDADSGEALSDEELRDEVMTLFLAGHETTANALTWALSLLALHPEVASKLEREVDEVLGGRMPEYADLPRLQYAACVFKETMRLYPPAYQVGRSTLTETRIGGYRVPRGRVVLLSVHAVQRRADVFDDPETFRPERFLDGAEKRWPRGAYIPFSVGPRVCVGNHFALMEAQLVLVRLAQRLRLGGSISRLVDTDPLVTLRPRERVMMRVTSRKPMAQAI